MLDKKTMIALRDKGWSINDIAKQVARDKTLNLNMKAARLCVEKALYEDYMKELRGGSNNAL